MIQKNKLLLYITGFFILFAIFSIVLFNLAKANNSLDLIQTNEAVDPYKRDIEFFQNQLQKNDLSDDTRTQVAGKLYILSIAATQRAEGLTQRPTRPIIPDITPQRITGYRIPDGINNTPEAPFSRLYFTPLNSWLKTTADTYYLVYSGYLTEDIEQGAVYVFHPDIHSFSLYITPDRRGAVRAVSENDTTVTIETTDGTLFYFNAAIEQFVDAQGTPFPATPTPFNNLPSTPIPYP